MCLFCELQIHFYFPHAEANRLPALGAKEPATNVEHGK